MTDDRYQKRLQQKRLFGKWGMYGVVPSMIILFAGLIFENLFVLASIGQMLFFMSVSFAIVFSRIGWSKNRLVDIILNQLSILLAFLGFCLLFLYVQYDLSFQDTGYILIIASFILVWIGNRTH